MKARCSSCHWVVSRVITDGDSPAAESRRTPPMPARSRRSTGRAGIATAAPRSPWALAAPRRHDRALEPCAAPRCRDRCAGRSPAAHDLDRAGRGGDRPWPGVPVAHHQPPAGLVDQVAAGQRCTRQPPAPARPPACAERLRGTISSSVDDSSSPVDSSATIFNIGVSFLAGVANAGSSSRLSTRKVRRALERVADPQLQVIPLFAGAPTPGSHKFRSYLSRQTRIQLGRQARPGQRAATSVSVSLDRTLDSVVWGELARRQGQVRREGGLGEGGCRAQGDRTCVGGRLLGVGAGWGARGGGAGAGSFGRGRVGAGRECSLGTVH